MNQNLLLNILIAIIVLVGVVGGWIFLVDQIVN